MSAKTPIDRVINALDDDNVVPLGPYTLQANGEDGLSISYPKAAARKNDVDVGDDLEGYLYGSNGAMIFLPEEILDELDDVDEEDLPEVES